MFEKEEDVRDVSLLAESHQRSLQLYGGTVIDRAEMKDGNHRAPLPNLRERPAGTAMTL